jgi:aldehyde dehydrogenase (NAD+)
MLKPSESASKTARLIAKIISSVFDAKHFTVVRGGPEIGSALLREKFDNRFYTGSERIGRLYAEAASKCIAPITLEPGGPPLSPPPLQSAPRAASRPSRQKQSTSSSSQSIY